MVRHAPTCGTHPRSKYWLSRDCCGWVCAILTWTFLLYASFVMHYAVLKPWKGDPFSLDPERAPNANGWFHYIGFYGCVVLAIWSHLKTMLTDPGAVPLDAIPLDYYNEPPYTGKFQSHHEICRQCGTYKPRTAHHCSVCKRCIVGMDHHCVWSNTCVARVNHKFFLLFVLYVFVACVWANALLFARTLACVRGYQVKSDGTVHQTLEFCDKSPANHSLMCIFLGVEAFFFGMFTLCMLCDQYGVISSGASQIDQLKAKKHRKEIPQMSWSERLSHVFGDDGRFSVMWFFPVDVRWKNPEKEFGFMLPRKIAPSGSIATDGDGDMAAGKPHDEQNAEEGHQNADHLV